MENAQISSATTVAQFLNVADNGAITKLITDGAVDGKYTAFYAAIEDKALIGKLEALAARTNNILDAEAAINIIAEHLADIKKNLDPVKTASTVVIGDDFLLATKNNPPVQNEKRFVLSQLRTWGEIKTPKAGGDAYKSVTVDGYYLVDTDQGIDIVSGQFVSNTALFKSFLKEIDLKDNQTIDLSAEALAFMIRTDEHIANVTTYPESSLKALSQAKKRGINPTINTTTGVASVLCFHKVSNKAVFRGLGAKINATLSAKLESIAFELLDAKAKANAEAQSKRVDNQLAIEMSAAETKNLNEKVSGLLDTLSNNSDKIAALNIDAQALMIAALMNNNK